MTPLDSIYDIISYDIWFRRTAWISCLYVVLSFVFSSGQSNIDDTIAILNARNKYANDGPEVEYGHTSHNDSVNISIISRDESGNDVSVDERPVSAANFNSSFKFVMYLVYLEVGSFCSKKNLWLSDKVSISTLVVTFSAPFFLSRWS